MSNANSYDPSKVPLAAVVPYMPSPAMDPKVPFRFSAHQAEPKGMFGNLYDPILPADVWLAAVCGQWSGRDTQSPNSSDNNPLVQARLSHQSQ